MQLAVGVLAILVAPMLVIAVDPYPETVFYKDAIFAIGAAGVVLLVASVVLEPKKGPGRPIDERATGRFMNVLALLAAEVIAIAAMVFGTSQLNYALITCAFAVVWSLAWIPAVMRRVSMNTHVLINRDPATVFAFVSDFRNEPKYVPEVESVEKITEGNIGPGTQFRTRVRLGDTGTFEGVEEIVDYEWAHRLTERVASGRRPNVGVLTFEPVQAATLLSYRFQSEVTYAGALLGEGLLRWALTTEMRRRRNAIWATLKQVLETPAAPGP